jgi:hypothetical protein
MKNNVKIKDNTQSLQSCVSVSVTDLRIGNWIMDRGNKAWQIDCWEHSTKVASKEPIIGICNFTKKPIHGHPLTEEVNFLKPIPLTEEWLLKFGFKQKPINGFEINYFTDCKESAEKMGILINLCSNRCAILDTDTDEQSAMTSKIIYYVHQLQNIYFALTGSELQIGNLTEH